MAEKKTFKGAMIELITGAVEQEQPEKVKKPVNTAKPNKAEKKSVNPIKKPKAETKSVMPQAKRYLASADVEVPAGYKLIVEKRQRRVQLVLQPSLYEEVKARADKAGLSFNTYVHKLLEEGTNANKH